MDLQDSKYTYGVQYTLAQISNQMLQHMNEYNKLQPLERIDSILHEATTVLQAARHHALELSEVGVSNDEFHRMRVLIVRVAASSYTSLGNKIDFLNEVRELKIVKEVILRAAEMRFGHTSNVLSEFRYPEQQKTTS